MIYDIANLLGSICEFILFLAYWGSVVLVAAAIIYVGLAIVIAALIGAANCLLLILAGCVGVFDSIVKPNSTDTTNSDTTQ